MIETRLLHYFLAVAREQNITKAAQTLFISQSTLSKQMMDLEKHLRSFPQPGPGDHETSGKYRNRFAY